MPARTIIIGDVHGCIHELDRLLEQFGLSADDRVVMVGDLVAKGPDSTAVVHLLRRLGAQSVIGNHDVALLRYHRARVRGEPLPEAHDTVRKTERKLDDEDWAWLEHLPYTIALPEHDGLVVHAGLLPGVPLELQKPEDMITMRSLRPDGTASKRLDEGVPWASRWIGPPHVYFGHDAVTGLQHHAHATGLDTACVYGGRLTGLVLPDHELLSVKAKRVYSEPGKAIAARHAGVKNEKRK